MNYIGNIGIGDLLFRPKFFGFMKVEHVGVAVAPNLVLHNTPERGEHISTVQEFAADQTVRIQQTGANPVDVVSRAKKVLAAPKRYNIWKRNCEHTAHETISGHAKSPFVLAALCILLLVGLFIWLLRR